jgi:general secretion pathway protein B
MSYILDALKRADAERERGVVPGLYARQLAGSGARTGSPARKLLIIASGTVLLLVAMGTALWLWRPATESAPRVAAEQTAAKPAPLPPAMPASAPVNAPEIAATAQIPVQQIAQTLAAAPLPTPTAPAKPATIATLSPTPKTTASAPPAPAPAAAAPLLAELSDDIRRQIPALTITGAVYSDNPGQRLLLLNNQVLPQGSLAAPEVTLEEIGAKSSTFSFRGNRFRLQH